MVTIARLDTAANTDAVCPKLASVLKSNKVQWSAKGGAYVEVCGASSVRPTGFQGSFIQIFAIIGDHPRPRSPTRICRGSGIIPVPGSYRGFRALAALAQLHQVCWG